MAIYIYRVLAGFLDTLGILSRNIMELNKGFYDERLFTVEAVNNTMEKLERETEMDSITKSKSRYGGGIWEIVVKIGKIMYLMLSIGTTLVIVIIITIMLSLPSGRKRVKIADKYTGLKVYPEEDVICFNSSDPSSYDKYVLGFEKFIKPYKEINIGGKVIRCDKENRKDNNNDICYIDQTWIYPCGNVGWGFDRGTPCVIIYYSDDNSSTYEPIPYKTLEDLPSNAPTKLREFLMDEIEEHGYFDSRVVSLYCTHSDPYDYHPKGFYDFFFPISKAESSLPPIASVQFDFQRWDDDGNMFLHTGEYDVECSLWSKEPDEYEIKKLFFRIKHGNC